VSSTFPLIGVRDTDTSSPTGLDAIQRVVEKIHRLEKEGKDLHEVFGKDLAK